MNTRSNSAVGRRRTLAALEFRPILSKRAVDAHEDIEDAMWGERRRLALIVLTKTKSDLVNGFASEQGYDDAQDLVDQLAAYRKHLNTLRDLVEAAILRMNIAIACNEGGARSAGDHGQRQPTPAGGAA